MEHRRQSDVLDEGEVAVVESPTPEEGAAAELDHGGGISGIRASDIEPYTGLRYLSKLFRFMAIILLLLLVAEIVTGIYAQGPRAIATLLGEASRLIVIAGVLWGTGDLAHLLIDVGHDVRAARVLLARQTYHIVRDITGSDEDAITPAPRSRSEMRAGNPPPIP